MLRQQNWRRWQPQLSAQSRRPGGIDTSWGDVSPSLGRPYCRSEIWRRTWLQLDQLRRRHDGTSSKPDAAAAARFRNTSKQSFPGGL